MHQEHQNPLEVLPLITKLPTQTTNNSNRSGRPTVDSIVRFGPQPQSIVAHMLSKLKTNKNSLCEEDDVHVDVKDSVEHNESVHSIISGDGIPISDSVRLKTSVSHNKSLKRSKESTKNEVKLSAQTKLIVNQTREMKRKPADIVDNIDILANLPNTALEDSSICSHKNSNKELEKHKPFLCDFPKCNYSCKLSSNLIKHKRVHTNEKPYLCEKCCFRSNFINSLKAHKRIHTTERPYQCMYCSYKCNSSSNLKKHCLHRHSSHKNCHCDKT